VFFYIGPFISDPDRPCTGSGSGTVPFNTKRAYVIPGWGKGVGLGSRPLMSVA
jgi:hypothetical protein